MAILVAYKYLLDFIRENQFKLQYIIGLPEELAKGVDTAGRFIFKGEKTLYILCWNIFADIIISE